MVRKQKDYYAIVLPVAADVNIGSPTLVVPASPKRLREKVEIFGRWFSREMRYSCVFEASDTPDKQWFTRYEAYLFHEDAEDLWDGNGTVKQRFFGACCFRWRERGNAPAYWTLQWVWLHPFFRGRGHLRDAWPIFEQKYGRFDPEGPFSCGMEIFLKKIGWLEPTHPMQSDAAQVPAPEQGG